MTIFLKFNELNLFTCSFLILEYVHNSQVIFVFFCEINTRIAKKINLKIMRCHYEILEISREADDSEIKTAYRKLALKWHPDKNLDNTEDAKEQFQLVQQAYEILSDRQERAWYDKHREQILRGSNSNYQDNNLDVFQYFTTTCFKGYGDDEMGFYCVYRKVFEQIAKEDFEYMDKKQEMYNIPKFGGSKSDYEEIVAPFYDHWMSYSTKKSYVWLDPHDIKEAVNRKIFKLIEKENDKIRQKAKKERNEEIRSLVAFVRKRDKRVQTHIKDLEMKKLENREKQKKLSNQKRLDRIRQLNESSEQAEWMKFDNVKTELEEMEKKLAAQFGDEISDSDDNSEEEEDLNSLYCVACNKIFKTPKAFKNHESSKKHKENVENLKEIMTSDDFVVDDENFSDAQIESSSKSNIDENESNNSLDECNINESNSDSELKEVRISESKSSKKKNKKGKNVIKIVEFHSDEEVKNGILENFDKNSDDEVKIKNKKQKRNKKKDKQLSKDNNVAKSDETRTVDNRKISVQSDAELELDKDKYCAKCKAHFPSKNKLFEHLKKTGHSCYLGTNISNGDRTKKKGVKQK